MKKTILLPLLCMSNAFAYQVIEIKEGDTLSDVLYKNNIKPLYGKNRFVEKTLKLNRLSFDSTKQLRPGDVIVIPKDVEAELKKLYITQTVEKTIHDEVNTNSAAISRTGLLAGFISEHQTVTLDMDYFQRSFNFSDSNVRVRENFGVNLSIRSNNNYNLSKITWDPEIYAGMYTQNSAAFSDNGDLNANFRPSWVAGTKIHMTTESIPVTLNAYAEMEEISSIDQDENDYIVRRDQLAFIGFGLEKNLNLIKNTNLVLTGQAGASIMSKSFNNMDEMRVYKNSASASINLTSDYFLGVFAENYQISNAALNNNNIFGTKLTYKF